MSNGIEAAELPVRASGQGWTDLGLTPEDAERAWEDSAERTATAEKARRRWVGRRTGLLPHHKQRIRTRRHLGVTGQTRTQEVRWTNEHGYPAGEYRACFRRSAREWDGERWSILRARAAHGATGWRQRHAGEGSKTWPQLPIMAHLGEPAKNLVSTPHHPL